ncbi:Gfo/Idh/MocA family protein [Helicobacter sp. MIT 99-5507]|uniref:Gfo/Idh/MocA family protein n=1 Tax=Helicobacter sp. MIT 99-5507 TaxID=152489 RepID=UPI000E1E9BEE|nr:Gfo/Idh/MocA family oxidoreductase [Helicobacter sp. MIT 99-5507]RDU58605.1 gfo/Idh/MocA family oxidoreductase [Helicobacter sp. MIT 99-5507]
MSILRLGFIGGSCDSAIGYTHFVSTRMDNKFEICCACFSTNKEINHKTAYLWDSNIRIYDDYKDLLKIEQGKIDAICILTPTPTHKQILLDCIRYGYAVVVEKTLCRNLNEAKEIAAALQDKNIFLAVIYNYTGYPMIRELRYMIENGEFGDIFQINIEMPQESFICKNDNGEVKIPQSWRLTDGIIPIISLDLGIHCHNLIYFLTHKKALNVYSKYNGCGNFKNIIDNVNIFATYEDNISVNMWFSKCALGHRNGLKLRIFGSKSSCEWLQSNSEELILNTQSGERIIKDRASPNLKIASLARYNRFKAGHPQGFLEAFANYYYDIAISLVNFKNGIDSTSPYIFGLGESKEGLLFFESATLSAQKNNIVEIDYRNMEVDK